MHQPLRKSVRETRAILADISTAEIHPSAAEKPEPGSPFEKHITHALHAALLKSGKLASSMRERKVPQWPLKGESIDVLGYGAEKVVYKVSAGDSTPNHVVSVFHFGSMKKDPNQVIKDKRANFEIYRNYFGDLVIPTSFIIVDNPWGDGAKPAIVQPFIENAEKFSDLSRDEIDKRATADPQFEADIRQLARGYTDMMTDGLRPDFASSNLLVSGSEIAIFDTGWTYPANKLSPVIQATENYHTIEILALSMDAK